MFNATIEASTLKALLMFAAKQDNRYYLNGVYFETTNTGTCAVATNGYCIAVARIDETQGRESCSVLVHRDHIEAILKTNKYSIKIDTMPDNQVKLTGTGGAVTVPVLDGVYPDWRRVVKAPQTGERAYFNPDYLALVNKAGQIINKRVLPYIVQQNGDSVGYCSLNDVVHAYVMPLRAYPEVVSAPTWY
jgi:DNA polymerase-3 subunit beta